MSEAPTPKKITLVVDDQEIEVLEGTNIIEAVKQLKKEIPHYCYHPKLSVAGNCRMCLVEMGMPMKDRATGEPILDEHGKPKVGWMPKPAIACGTNATQGMHIRTDSALVKNCQEGVMEFLLINHPLDCPICDQAGECSLQEFAAQYGRGCSRFTERKNVKPKRTKLGPRVTLDDERCILCSRCIRFCKDIVKDDVLGFIDRGSYSTLTCFPGKQLNNNYSLNTVDICPVGALTSTDFRFKMRTWFLKRTQSICSESSVGTNTEIWSREGKIYRITPRRNDEVNDTWMSDSARMLYKTVEDENRLTQFSLNRGRASCAEALERIRELIAATQIAYVGSGHNSVEEHFLLKRISEIAPGQIYFLSHEQEGDGLLISKDKTPNLRSAFVNGLIDKYPQNNLSDLKQKIETGEVTCLMVYNEDVTTAGIAPSLLKKINVIYLGTHSNETSKASRVTCPTLTVFEKSGTFINQQFRLQKFHQAIPGPMGTIPDIALLCKVVQTLDPSHSCEPTLANIWKHLGENIPTFNNLSFQSLPDTGHLLDATPFKHIPFCEGPTLHFDPKAN